MLDEDTLYFYTMYFILDSLSKIQTLGNGNAFFIEIIPKNESDLCLYFDYIPEIDKNYKNCLVTIAKMLNIDNINDYESIFIGYGQGGNNQTPVLKEFLVIDLSNKTYSCSDNISSDAEINEIGKKFIKRIFTRLGNKNIKYA